MNKENLIKRIDENYEDMIDAIHDNCAGELCEFDLVALFRDYTDEIIKIINEECV